MPQNKEAKAREQNKFGFDVDRNREKLNFRGNSDILGTGLLAFLVIQHTYAGTEW